MAMDAEARHFAGTGVEIECLGENLEEAATRLFAAMRALDKRGVSEILAKYPERNGMGLALGDRLLRAAIGRVIDVPRS